MEDHHRLKEAAELGKLLELIEVTKLYDSGRKSVVGVEKVSFEVREGEFISIIGPSGCGKSTLLRCIAGFEKLSSGKILLEGNPVSKPGPDRFMVFQGLDQLFPWLTVKENITFAMKAVKKIEDKEEINEKARQYLELVGLAEWASCYPYQLSGGMKQRAAIARALSVNPKVLLMDEPFGSLDAFSRRVMQQMLIKVWQKTGVTILFVTHDIEEAIDLSDRILAFSPGRLKADLANSLPRPRTRDLAAYRTFLLEISALLDPVSTAVDDFDGVSVPEAKLAF